MRKLRLFLLFAFAYFLSWNAEQCYAKVPTTPGDLSASWVITDSPSEIPAAGDFASSEKLLPLSGVVVHAPIYHFGVVGALVFLLRAITLVRAEVAVGIIVPLFTSSYFSNLFCSLIAINAP